jgi:hypothetical protein
MKKIAKSAMVWALLAAILIAAAACNKKPAVTPDQVNTAFAKAKAAYDNLMKLNPPETMTYNYRNIMSQAEQAKAAGKFEQAISLAGQAEEQAVLTAQVIQERTAKLREQLDQAKDQLELLFPVNKNLIKKYWELDGRLRARDIQNLDTDIDDFLNAIAQQKKTTVMDDRKVSVYAPQEYIKQYGNVRLYKEVTPDGKLKDVVDTLDNGARVKVTKIMIFAPGVNFYYVQTGLGAEGWMLEKYLMGEGSKF